MELIQENDVNYILLNEEQKLWNIADSFRLLVCSELRKLSPMDRISLKGDYLFLINDQARFIVMVDEMGSWSVCLHKSILNGLSYDFEIDTGCPWPISITQILNVIDGSSRSKILTDSKTLYKLLVGTLKAHVAFVTGKVTITGDLSAFLKMVSLLKRNGVKPKND